MRGLAVCCVIVAAHTVPCFVFAESPAPECGHLLQPDVESLISDRSLAAAFFSAMTTEQFNAIEAKGGLDVPGYFSGDYQKTKNSGTRHSREMGWTLNGSEAVSYYSSRIPRDRSAAFVECMHGKPLSISLRDDRIRDTEIVLRLLWERPSGVGPLTLRFTTRNAESIGELPASFGDRAEVRLAFRRGSPHEPFVVIVNGNTESGGAYSDDFIDPAAPRKTIGQRVYSFTMSGGGAGTPTPYLVVPRHYNEYHQARGMIQLKIPTGASMQLNTATSESVSFTIATDHGSITEALSEGETAEWFLDNYLYRITCTEIDNGPKGRLDWARFRVDVFPLVTSRIEQTQSRHRRP